MSLITTQYPEPVHFLLHFSDTHLLPPGELLYGQVNCTQNLETTLGNFEKAKQKPSAILFTGDLADAGHPEAYRQLRATVYPWAERLGAEVIWLMGNHDARAPFRTHLLHEKPSNAPIDQCITIDGLRIITLDTTVPGQHYGQLTNGQLDWLAAHLATTPSQHGTILAMHHPPIPSPLGLMSLVELRDSERLIPVIADSDVRAILAGHLHYPSYSTFAGIPVSVASATCYTQDLQTPFPGVRAQNGGQSYNMVHIYPDRILHSTVPTGTHPTLYEVSGEQLSKFLDLTPAQQLEALNKTT